MVGFLRNAGKIGSCVALPFFIFSRAQQNSSAL